MSEPEDQSAEEPKIIVDSDWKEQVAKEREAALDPESTPPAAPEADANESGDEIPPPPPATFEVLVSMLFSQALSMLGQLPDPSGQTKVNKVYAKHTIDTLEMLDEKTKGNRSDDESKILSEALHALRMAYVSVKA